jgi:hypothetical protein
VKCELAVFKPEAALPARLPMQAAGLARDFWLGAAFRAQTAGVMTFTDSATTNRGEVMTKLLQHIEEMRVRLSEIAGDEQALVQALGDAFKRLDQQLLRNVRTTAADHELRREEVLSELQDLAVFRQPLAPPQASEELLPSRRANVLKRIIGPRDWRKAISKAPSS